MIKIEEMKLKIKEFARNRQFLLLVLFGSQATGKTHPQSDVDIGFLSERKMGPGEIARLQFELSQKLRIKNLELVDLKNAPPLLLKEVAQKSILLYEKEPMLFANFKIYFLKLFMEAEELLALKELSLNKFLQRTP